MRVFSLLLLVLSFHLCSAQRIDDKELPQPDPNYEKYLKDGVLHDADGNIQWAVTSMLLGSLELSYEQKIQRNLSVEVGGMTQIIGMNDALDVAFLQASLLDPQRSFGYSVAGKYYPQQRAITQKAYSGLRYIYKRRVGTDEYIASHDVQLLYGAKGIIGNAISLDLGYGLGIRMYDYELSENNVVPASSVYLSAQIYAKVGYYLKY